SSRHHLCRSHSTWREAGGATRSVADQVRDGRKPQDRQGARPCRTPIDFGALRRGDRIASTSAMGPMLSAPAGVLLSPNGDFKIDDMLSPLPPAVCLSPMLLIRNAANPVWFAVGIFRDD